MHIQVGLIQVPPVSIVFLISLLVNLYYALE
nr:MAG TPA: hypothetical protein [Caudoviricetes sp.]DAY99308.1 MAG TPA: hypothetical protein [Caudoviricetes sp.]